MGRLDLFAARSTFVISLGAVALLLLGLVRETAVSRGRETIIGKVFDALRGRFGGRLSTSPSCRSWSTTPDTRSPRYAAAYYHP